MKPINKPKDGDTLFYVCVDSMCLYVYGKDELESKQVFIEYLTLKKSKHPKITVRKA